MTEKYFVHVLMLIFIVTKKTYHRICKIESTDQTINILNSIFSLFKICGDWNSEKRTGTGRSKVEYCKIINSAQWFTGP